RLLYSNDLFVIYNATTQTISLEDIALRRNEPKNSANPTVLSGSLEAGKCLAMERRKPQDVPLPIICPPDTEAPTQYDGSNIFWVPRDEKNPVTTFLVEKHGQPVQTCSMNLNPCEFPPP